MLGEHFPCTSEGGVSNCFLQQKGGKGGVTWCPCQGFTLHVKCACHLPTTTLVCFGSKSPVHMGGKDAGNVGGRHYIQQKVYIPLGVQTPSFRPTARCVCLPHACHGQRESMHVECNRDVSIPFEGASSDGTAQLLHFWVQEANLAIHLPGAQGCLSQQNRKKCPF